LPSNNLEEPPRIQPSDDANRQEAALDNIIPDDGSSYYDMKDIIEAVVDDRDFFELHPLWAQNMVVGFARLNGRTVGIVGNQPKTLGGVLDIDASVKAGRFVRFCDAFNIPLLTFVDAPGFLPEVDQEHGGIIRHGSKLLYAYCEATVPKITVVTRRAYGAAYVVMCSKHIRGDVNYAWPTAETMVMGPEGAARIIFSKEIAEAKNLQERISELTEEYRKKFANPCVAAERGYVDDIIMPHETRPRVIKALEALANKRESRPAKKHGNIPL
jgi:propionyl-CoA carboxylase beta chain